MNHVVWHPEYDPEASTSCDCFDEGTVYVRNSYSWSGCGSGDQYIPPGNYSICGNTREIFIDPTVQADGNRTRWSGHYLNWYFSDAADGYATDITATDNGCCAIIVVERSNSPPLVPFVRASASGTLGSARNGCCKRRKSCFLTRRPCDGTEMSPPFRDSEIWC